MSRLRFISSLQRVLFNERALNSRLRPLSIVQNSYVTDPAKSSPSSSCAWWVGDRALHTSSIRQLIQKKKKVGFKDDDEDKLDDDEDSDSDSDEEEDDGVSKDYKELTVNLLNNRLDTLIKAAFGQSRSNAESKIMEGNVYINEERCTKKSTELSDGDTVDIFRQASPDNVKLSIISRAVIVKIAPEKKKGKTEMKLNVWKEMVVSDYSDTSSE